MGNGLVNFVDGGIELLASEAIVATEGVLESQKLVLKVGDIHALTASNHQLALVVHSFFCGIHQEGDDSLEELGADDVHLRVLRRSEVIDRSPSMAFVERHRGRHRCLLNSTTLTRDILQISCIFASHEQSCGVIARTVA